MTTHPTTTTTTAAEPVSVTLVSFGYLHDTPPTADLVLDVRRYLRDPAAAQTILDLDGRNPVVQQTVMATPGALSTLTLITGFAATFPTNHPCVIAVGCAGGRHRSAALIELAATVLRANSHPVTVEHRHIHLPRILHPAGNR